MSKFVALLRGINVGGNNMIKMSDLKACFEASGFANARTYINSGNVIFESMETDTSKLTDKIEKALDKTFAYKSRVVLLTDKQLKSVIQNAPKGFGTQPDKYYSDVIFLKPPLTAAEAMQSVETKEGVDQASEGQGVLYFSRLSARRTQSRLSRVVAKPAYQNMTIRSWTTTTKLLSMLDA